MVRIGRLEKPAHVIRPPGQHTGPEPTRFWGQWSIALGLLTFTSGLFLLLMFISLSVGGSAAPWGPINDFLSGITNLMLAALMPVLSRNAARGRWERYGVGLVAGTSVVAAASSFMLVAGRLGFEQSTAVSMVAIVLQVAWMFWLNRRYFADPDVPGRVSRFGITFAAALLTAMAVFGASFALPPDTLARTVLQWVAGSGGGVAWLSWPLWFILLGRHLTRR